MHNQFEMRTFHTSNSPCYKMLQCFPKTNCGAFSMPLTFSAKEDSTQMTFAMLYIINVIDFCTWMFNIISSSSDCKQVGTWATGD